MPDPFFALLPVIIARFPRFFGLHNWQNSEVFGQILTSFLYPLLRIGWIGRWVKSELIWKKYEILPKGEKPDKTLLNSESSVDKAN